MKIALIILNWNSFNNTLDCLESITRIKRGNFDLYTVVVDNASTDNSLKNIKKSFPSITIIENKSNLGFAAGNNTGISYALKEQVDFIFIVNNDTILDRKIIENLIHTAETHRCDIVSPKIYFQKGYEFHKNKYKKTELGKVIWYAGGKIDWKNIKGFHIGVDEVDKGQFDKEKETDYATGAAIFVRGEVFNKIGLFDEKYYLYYEDLDFCWRAKIKGIKIMFSPKSILWHKNAGSSFSGSTLQDYYITRNRLLFGFKYAPFRNKLALSRESLKIILKGRLWQKKAVFDFILGNFGKGSYPL